MDMEREHSINIVNRESATLTAITDVDSFTEEEIVAVCELGEIRIKGSLLHIEELSLESGLLSISGKINCVSYSERVTASSVFKRLFAG